MIALVDLSGLQTYDVSEIGTLFHDDTQFVKVSDVSAMYAAAPACPDPVVETNVALLRSRSAVSVEKYGTTLAGNQLPLRAWLVHALEESLDHANYLQAAMQEIDGAPALHTFQQRVQPWMLACFGEVIACDREERTPLLGGIAGAGAGLRLHCRRGAPACRRCLRPPGRRAGAGSRRCHCHVDRAVSGERAGHARQRRNRAGAHLDEGGGDPRQAGG